MLISPEPDQEGNKLGSKSETSAISTTSRRELSSGFFFLQGNVPKEIHAILTETLACFLPGLTKNLPAPLYASSMHLTPLLFPAIMKSLRFAFWNAFVRICLFVLMKVQVMTPRSDAWLNLHPSPTQLLPYAHTRVAVSSYEKEEATKESTRYSFKL